MPLRDHFRPPVDKYVSWESVHGGWPMVIVQRLHQKLPPRYVASPRVRLGAVEVDIGALERQFGAASPAGSAPHAPAGAGSLGNGPAGDIPAEQRDEGGGVATAVWAPTLASLEVATELPDMPEYEVRVVDVEQDRRLVAAIEIVSPGNKDRPEHRRLFVAKCFALLRRGVSLCLVDIVSTREFNLYAELLALLEVEDPALGVEPPPLYAVACRWRSRGLGHVLEAWNPPVGLGAPLPTLPLWLADELAVALELEATYEQTCRDLRVP